MKKYMVKVTEKHTDIVLVDAESRDEAKKKAVELSECDFDCVYDSEIIREEEIEDCDKR